MAPDLWKLHDKDGDGIPDEKTSLSHGYGVHIGFGGHGMSGIEMGPDGRIYWQIGDIGFNGKGPDGKTWEYPNSGVIARCNPMAAILKYMPQAFAIPMNLLLMNMATC